MATNFANLVTAHPDGLIVVDHDGRVLFTNSSARVLLAYGPAWSERLPAAFLLHHENLVRVKSQDDPPSELILEVRRMPVEWRRHAAHMLSVRDVTQIFERSAVLRLAYQDELTGLYNRRGLEFVGMHEWARAKRSGNPLTVLFADLDNLKLINDRFGHHEGDCALAETAQLLSKVFRYVDIVARFGGDEFVVLFVEEHAPSTATQLLRRLNAEIVERNASTDRQWTLSVSIGIARQYPKGDSGRRFELGELIARADQDMYRAKRIRHVVSATKHRGGADSA